jgi:hypothetical protein
MMPSSVSGRVVGSASPASAEHTQARGDLSRVAPHIGRRFNTTLSKEWVAKQQTNLPREQGKLIQRATDALMGEEPAINAKEDERGGSFELSEVHHGAQFVHYQRDEVGQVSALQVSDKHGETLASIGDSGAASPAKSPSPSERPAKRMRTATGERTVLPSSSKSSGAREHLEMAATGQKRSIAAVDESDPPPSPTAFTPIRMKSKQEQEAKGLPGGVADVNLRLAERAAVKGKNGMPLQPGKHPPVAQCGEDGVWRGSVEGGDATPLHGKFIFVTMQDGAIRLGNSVNGQNAHAQLARSALEVRYAGNVQFEHGELRGYDNESGTYMPPGALRAQSGFGDAPFRDAALATPH